MPEQDESWFIAVDTQLATLADAIHALQQLVQQHHAAIKALQQPMRDPDRAHPPL